MCACLVRTFDVHAQGRVFYPLHTQPRPLVMYGCKMDPALYMKAEWKYTKMESGRAYVMMTGALMMQTWFVNS